MFLDEYPPPLFLQNQTGYSHANNVKQQQKFSLGSISISFATTIQPIWVRGYDVHVSAPYRIIETIRPDKIVTRTILITFVDVDQSTDARTLARNIHVDLHVDSLHARLVCACKLHVAGNTKSEKYKKSRFHMAFIAHGGLSASVSVRVVWKGCS